MNSSVKSLDRIKLNTEAMRAAREYTKLMGDAITAQSKILAASDGSDQVQAIHVVRGYSLVLSSAAKDLRWRQTMGGIGTLLLGAAAQGVYTEFFANDPKPIAFVVCFLMGLVGLALWFVSIFKR